MISPGQNFCENTLNTLRYANRVKELKHSTDGSAHTDGHIVNDKLIQNPPYTVRCNARKALRIVG